LATGGFIMLLLLLAEALVWLAISLLFFLGDSMDFNERTIATSMLIVSFTPTITKIRDENRNESPSPLP
jgi:hypothetical protein